MIEIAGRTIGPGQPVFIVAELSANARTLSGALELIRQAQAAGADAIKTQAYTPESLTIDCDNAHFQIKSGPWQGQTLWRLYQQAAMPREWHKTLADYTESLGMVYFSTAFCPENVDFLEDLGVPCHKIASFEITDLPLIRYAASKGKPMIVSTGMATEAEIWDALEAVRGRGNACGSKPVILLKCTSGYPAPLDSLNLQGIGVLPFRYNAIPGLSDHTLSIVPPVASVALGACIIEKHLTLSRLIKTPDADFSLEPHEFKAMVEAVRDCEAALGDVRFGPTESEAAQTAFRRSLFMVADIQAGQEFMCDNVRSIRPTGGLAPNDIDQVLGRRAARDIGRGTPLSLWMIDGPRRLE
ncbi:MAG: pseudaminic acid synthase [Chloroflexi bacterium]|nr:pseudaminic acid synthase [Chloroflexota bacterium]